MPKWLGYVKKKGNEKKLIKNKAELLCYAAEHNITVIQMHLKNDVSLSMPTDDETHCYIGINMKGLPENLTYTALLHETGHCETGSFYNQYSRFDITAKQEYRANKWAAEHALPKEALEQAAAEGYTEAWQLAEYFGVTEDFVRFAYAQYFIN